MSPAFLAGILLFLTVIGFYMGRSKALKTVSGQATRLHSLPGYYGYFVALWCGIPALFIFTAWLIFEPLVVEGLVVSALPEAERSLAPERLGLLLNDIRNLAGNGIVSRDVDPELRAAADYYLGLRRIGSVALAVADDERAHDS